MSTQKKPTESSQLKIELRINLDKILPLLKRSIRRVGRVAIILLVCQLLDRPAVVVPENTFVVDLECQLDESFVSRIYPGLEHIWHSQAPACETV